MLQNPTLLNAMEFYPKCAFTKHPNGSLTQSYKVSECWTADILWAMWVHIHTNEILDVPSMHSVGSIGSQLWQYSIHTFWPFSMV